MSVSAGPPVQSAPRALKPTSARGELPPLFSYVKTKAGRKKLKNLAVSLPAMQQARGLCINMAGVTLGAALGNPAMVYSSGARAAVYVNGDIERAKKILGRNQNPADIPFDRTRFTADSSGINALTFALLWEGALNTLKNQYFTADDPAKQSALNKKYYPAAIASSLIVGPAVCSALSRFYILPTIKRKSAEEKVRKAIKDLLSEPERAEALERALKAHTERKNGKAFTDGEAGRAMIANLRELLQKKIKEDSLLSGRPDIAALEKRLEKVPEDEITQKKLNALREKIGERLIQKFLIGALQEKEKKIRAKADGS